MSNKQPTAMELAFEKAKKDRKSLDYAKVYGAGTRTLKKLKKELKHGSH